MFVSTSKDKYIKIWDAGIKTISQPLMSEKTKEENINLAVSPDGNYIGVSTVKDELSFYDLRNLKLIKQIKYNKVDINGFQWCKVNSPA